MNEHNDPLHDEPGAPTDAEVFVARVREIVDDHSVCSTVDCSLYDDLADLIAGFTNSIRDWDSVQRGSGFRVQAARWPLTCTRAAVPLWPLSQSLIVLVSLMRCVRTDP